jgi:hypothetical protein
MKKLKRRVVLTAPVVGMAVVAQNPATEANPVEQARVLMKANQNALARFALPIATEPAFQFQA